MRRDPISAAIRKLRRNDILLFSDKELTKGGSIAIKKLVSADFLMDMKKNPQDGMFLGVVTAGIFDNGRKVVVKLSEKTRQNVNYEHKYCYLIDSLITSVREF